MNAIKRFLKWCELNKYKNTFIASDWRDLLDDLKEGEFTEFYHGGAFNPTRYYKIRFLGTLKGKRIYKIENER